MSARPERHLALVDRDTGELVESQELGAMQHELEELRVKFKMAQRDVAAKNLRIAGLEADKARDRLDYERYADVERIARYWHRKCRPKDYALPLPRINPMTPERFDAIRGILDQQQILWGEPAAGKKRRSKRVEPQYSMVECKAAIDGVAFEHFVKKRKNGSEKHHDDLEFIFRNGTNFEECRARCPYDWQKVAIQGVTRNTDEEVPSTLAGSTREQARSEGSYGSSSVGVRVVRGPLHREGRWPVFRCRLAAGVDAQPA